MLDIRVPQQMEVKIIHIPDLLSGVSEYAADRCRSFIGSIRPQADEGNLGVIFRRCLCPGQGIDLVVGAIFFLARRNEGNFFRPSLRPYPAALRKFAWPLWWRGRKCSSWYGEYPSRPILIEREKREQKKKRERHPRPKPKAALPLCYGKVFKTASLSPLKSEGEAHMGKS